MVVPVRVTGWAFVASLILVLACSVEPCPRLARARSVGISDLERLSEEPAPRCRANDPACGPEPVEAEHACYHPSGKRERLPAGQSPDSGARDLCNHDGECRLAGCGNACVPYGLRDLDTNCLGYEWLDEHAFCGCVDRRCSFFRQ